MSIATLRAAPDEGGGSVGRREIHRRYVAPREIDAFERGDHEVVGARRLGDRDLLTFQAGNVLDRRGGWHEDRLTIATRRQA